MVCGDFNFPEIVWTDAGGISNGENEERFIEGLEEAFLTQCVDFPTFLHGGNNGSSLLDLVLTCDSERVLEVSQLPPLSISKKVMWY